MLSQLFDFMYNIVEVAPPIAMWTKYHNFPIGNHSGITYLLVDNGSLAAGALVKQD